MTALLEIETTAPELVARMEVFFARQVPFATAVALTRTAKRGQQLVRSRLASHFTVRRKTLGNAIQISPARKADWPNQEARVGIMFDWLAHHVTGETRRAGEHRLSIPVSEAQPKIRTSVGKTRRSLKAGRLIEANRASIQENAEGAFVLFHGAGRVHLGNQRSVIYILRERARIRATWPFVREVEETVRTRLEREYLRAMVHAARQSR